MLGQETHPLEIPRRVSRRLSVSNTNACMPLAWSWRQLKFDKRSVLSASICGDHWEAAAGATAAFVKTQYDAFRQMLWS